MEEEKETKTSKQDWKTPLIVIGSIVGLFLIIGAIDLISNSGVTGNVVDEGSQDSPTDSGPVFKKNCRQEQIPYEETETYYETVPYTDQECNTRNLEYYTEEWRTSESCTDTNFWGTCIEKKVDCIYGLKNIDKEGGIWSINMKLKNLDLMSEVNLGKQSQSIPQSVTKTFTWSYNTNRVDDSFTCEIISFDNPTIEECENVVRYKDVPRTRTVTKYKTEEVCD